MIKWLFSVIFFCLIVAFGVGTFLWLKLKSPSDPSDQAEIIFEVPAGQSMAGTAKSLEKVGLVQKANLFRLYHRLSHKEKIFKSGEYSLKKSMSPTEIIEILASGRSLEYPLQIVEGDTIFDIARKYELAGFGTRESFLNRVTDPEFAGSVLGYPVESLEGYLFPETYRFPKRLPIDEKIKSMVEQHKKVMISMPMEMLSFPLSTHEVVILASLIEKETGVPEERPTIASVFLNRLKKGMRLQSDPTILYGMWLKTGIEPKNISREDLRRPSEYNTYTLAALPKGPIANPGEMALKSVFYPARTEYLFFVSRNDGSHVFSKTYAEHNRAVDFWQRDPKNRLGKSWRDRLESTAN